MTITEQIPQPDDLIAEGPNPYRRPQKVIKIRRGETVRTRLAKALLGGILLPLVLLGAGYGVVQWMESSPFFLFEPDQDVSIRGNKIVSAADVLGALGNPAHGASASAFRLDLAEMRRRVESIPWIESATLTRVFPNRLNIEVVERSPIAYADVGGHIELVDKDGVFLELLKKASFDFPVLEGLDGADAVRRRTMLAQYEDFADTTRGVVRGTGWSISEVDLSDAEDLRVLMVQGRETVLVHFGDEDYAERLATFARVSPQVLANNPRIDSMDLRFSGEVVVDPQTANTEPSPVVKEASTGAIIHRPSPGASVRARARRRPALRSRRMRRMGAGRL